MTIYEFFNPNTNVHWYNLIDQDGQLIRTTANKSIANCLDETYLIDWHMCNVTNLQNYFGVLRSEALNLLD